MHSNSATNGNGAGAATNGNASPTLSSQVVDAAPCGPPDGSVTATHDFVAALSRLNIDVGDSELHPKQEGGAVKPGDQKICLSTNVYGLKTGDIPIYQYHLELMKEFKTVRNGVKEDKKLPLILSKEDGFRKIPDYTAFMNRKNNGKLLDALIAANPEVFGSDPDIFLYDFANTLFSLQELVIPDKKLVLDEEAVREQIDRMFTLTCEVKFAKSFRAKDFQSNFSSNLEEHSSDTIRFLELASSRYASRHPEEHVMYESKKTSFMNPGQYNMRSPDLGGGKYLAPGASKTVQLVQGPRNVGSTAIIIDSKKTPFYHTINLLQMLCDGCGFDPKGELSDAAYQAAEKYLKNLEVFPIYGNRQSIPIILKGFGTGTCLNNNVTKDGSVMNLNEYYNWRYKTTLQFPYLPVVAGAKKVEGKHPLYPLELLHVADYQRVGNGNITSNDIAIIVKACAVPPSVKSNEIANCHGSFAFNRDRFLKAAQIQILDQPLQVDGRILKAPTVRYGGNVPEVVPQPNGKWRIGRDAKFLHPAVLPKWSAIFLAYRGDRLTFPAFVQFVKKYQNEMRNRGMQFAPLEDGDIISVDANELALSKAFQESDACNYRFLLFSHPDRETNLHPYIKGLERKFEVITQCVKTKTIGNVLDNKMLSLENIVAKTNVKLGGINYSCVLQNSAIDSNILFIGLGMNHPGGGLGTPSELPANADVKYDGPFSVLGFAANDGVIPNEFVGNFFLQPTNRDEKVTILDSLVYEVLDRFIKNRGTPPSRVIFYRSGCSEGAFIPILRYELPVIRAMIRDMAPGAKLSIIIPSKMHSIRLFNTQINPGARADDQNIRPGTVVDSGITSMAYSEFYLNSHLALQGTAKTTKYTILYTDEENTTLDQFERWTNALAYDFQIVSSPTSLPAPLYIANRYAERGRQILNAFQTSEQANRSGELELEKKMNAAANGRVSPNGNGHSSPNGRSSPNGHGNASNGTTNGNGGCMVRLGNTPGQISAFYEKSTHFNFTNRKTLRSKRVNA